MLSEVFCKLSLTAVQINSISFCIVKKENIIVTLSRSMQTYALEQVQENSVGEKLITVRRDLAEAATSSCLGERQLLVVIYVERLYNINNVINSLLL